ncbi:hypothetical protein GCM10028778_24480 [Barrientosiimonas marina]|uniref:NERD domain-containing protein n=1 Tax=Lentibacillus kimchii TaxID=1542911 RepID=A0ABW2UWM0_9BACI
MAQLIKLEDYISRYERNIYRYPGQFIRMKQENWKNLLQLWQNGSMQETTTESEPVSVWSKWKELLGMKNRETFEKTFSEDSRLPETKEDLKHYFLDKLFPLQLQWASSTVAEVSFTKQAYEADTWLKFFLQRFSDTYLVMYYPVFNIRQAPVDGEIIVIGPTGIDIIYLADTAAGTTIWAEQERTWTIQNQNKQQTKMLNPLFALKRTEQIVKSILKRGDTSLPVTRVVLAPSSNLIFHDKPYNTHLIGKLEYENWFHNKRRVVSPLKNQQLKAAGLLLSMCRTTSVKRPEWEAKDAAFTNDYNDQ